MTPRGYRLYGISLRSEIPLTFPEQAIEQPDITITLQSKEWFEKSCDASSANTRGTQWYEHLECQDGSDFLRWPGLFEFLVSPDGGTVGCRALEGSSPESFQTYLLGQVLSFALTKQGHEPLHATAVVIDGAAVAFLGASGQGKSTLAAACLRSGFQALTDDLLVMRNIGGVLRGFPGPPRIKLFPEVAERFLPAEASLAPMNPDTPKSIIALPPVSAHGAPASIHAFFVLDGFGEGGVEITTFSGAAGCMELLGATFNRRVLGPARLRRQFAAVKEWSERIPVKRLRYAWGIDAIDHVVQAIVADVSLVREPVT